jgi:hypothetical protein
MLSMSSVFRSARRLTELSCAVAPANVPLAALLTASIPAENAALLKITPSTTNSGSALPRIDVTPRI